MQKLKLKNLLKTGKHECELTMTRSFPDTKIRPFAIKSIFPLFSTKYAQPRCEKQQVTSRFLQLFFQMIEYFQIPVFTF